MSPFPVPAFDTYWAMWNEQDPSKVRHLLDQSVTDDVVFCDPKDFHVGRDALEANVRQFRAEQPDVVFELASGVDTHHNRVRYSWHFIRRGRVLMVGHDVATISDDGLLERIDGFFGDLPALE